MVYNILTDLNNQGKLDGTVKIVINNNGDKETLMASSVKRFDRSKLYYAGGESNYEELSVPLKNILEIWDFEHRIFKKRDVIEHIFDKK